MLSFSTCWNSGRHQDGEAMVEEILEMGVDTIEISHGLKVSLLPGIKKAYRAGMMKVSGVHNFCPSPVELMIDAPDAYEFTSHRKNERERALSLTLKTIELAAEFQSKYVVLHLGSVPMKSRSKTLTDMVIGGGLNSRKFVKGKIAMIKEREGLGRLYLGRAREALARIAEHAEKFQVPVAVESRSHYEQVPSEREMAALMAEVAGPWVGYWHDFGHVQLKANLSLLDHYEWLDSMKQWLIGCHLHDVIWPEKDHRVPFQGTVDFDRLLPLVPVEKPIVWELSHRRKKEDILGALPIWKQKYAAWVDGGRDDE
ncbi:MAG: sugar phosphate isomerase/epimerase [Verrucomicrobiaceae bacterium]|nr:MAG: sugar phosphate isomerase/epimerase [Verrucomicrobiaceae bacterium]